MFYFYMWVLHWFMPVSVPPLGEVLGETIIMYVFVAVAINIKMYFKAKEKETYQVAYEKPVKAEDKLTMLQTLLDDGILSSEEYAEKCKIVQEGISS